MDAQRNIYANPSNQFSSMGKAAVDAVEGARQQVADLIDAEPVEVVFTGSAPESIYCCGMFLVSLVRTFGEITV